ncbi:MAG TPA: hypothetical protein VGF69_10560 [Thermoanaerobaculia bacterium]|jgi:hypothetical protein
MKAVGRWAERVWHALSASAGDIIISLSLGAASFWIGKRLTDPWSTVAEHLGTAFLVAAIAVFGYEYKSRSKELIKATNALVEALKAEAKPGAIRCITEMFSGADTLVVRLRDSLIRSLNASDDVVQAAVSHRDLAVGMIEALLDAATTNANEFKAKNHFTITIPRPAELIDEMLKARIERLGEAGTYVVISDFSSFKRNQLQKSIGAMRTSPSRGAKVQRIFYFFKHDRELPYEEIERIATDHWNLSCELGDRYQVAFVKPVQGQIEPLHEGVFTTTEGSVRFEVLEPDLHTVQFYSETQSRPPVNFERLWYHALKATAASSAEVEFGKYLALLRKWRQRRS